MKRLPFLISIGLTLTATASAQEGGSPPTFNHSGSYGISNSTAGASPITISQEEWQELRAARSAAIQANPDLMAENKKLLERMRALEDKVDAAMEKSDPTIVPIIAKFEAGRHAAVVPASATPSGSLPIK